LVIKVDRQLLKKSLADSYYSAAASQRLLKCELEFMKWKQMHFTLRTDNFEEEKARRTHPGLLFVNNGRQLPPQPGQQHSLLPAVRKAACRPSPVPRRDAPRRDALRGMLLGGMLLRGMLSERCSSRDAPWRDALGEMFLRGMLLGETAQPFSPFLRDDELARLTGHF